MLKYQICVKSTNSKKMFACLRHRSLAYVMTLSKQVLKENFETDADKNKSAEDFDFAFKEMA